MALAESAEALAVGTAVREPIHARRLVRNVATLAGSQVLTWAMSIAATVVVPRALGPSQMGTYAAATSVTSILALIGGFVTVDFLVRDMVVRRDESASVAGAAMLVRIAMTPVMLGAVYGYVRVAHIGDRAAPVFYLMAVAAAVNLMVDPMQAGFRSVERMEFVALSDLVVHSSSGVLAVVLVLLGAKAVGLAGAAAAVCTITLVANVFWARRLRRVSFTGSFAEIRSLVVRGIPYSPLQLVGLVYLYIDSVVLSMIQRPEVVGWYGVATRLFGTLLFVPTILAGAWYPRLIASFERSGDEFKAEVNPLLGAVVSLGVPVAAATAVGAGPVIRLMYGPAYDKAVPVMVVLGLCTVPMYMGIALGQVMMASKRPSALTAILLGGVGASVGLNLLLVPIFARTFRNGALGSAVSLLITEVLITGAEVIVTGRRLLGLTTFARLPRVALASAGMVAVAWATRPMGLPSLAFGGAAFIAAALLLRILTPDERTALRSCAGRLVPARLRRARAQHVRRSPARNSGPGAGQSTENRA